MSTESRGYRYGIVSISLSFFICVTVSCNQAKQTYENSKKKQKASPEDLYETEQIDQKQIGYAKGTWWQKKSSLKHVILSAAHILITHKESKQNPNRVGIWVAGFSERNKEDALELAQRLAEQAKQFPGQFGELARKHSDDSASSKLGGRLGVFRALSVPPSFIDALGNISEGEVSRVVESELGYHIIKRLPVPKEQSISGAQILIDYRGLNTEWAHPSQTTEYSRDEARKVADKVAQKAKQDPGTFSDLAKKYSKDPNAENGGDLGVWSTYELGSEPITLEVIANLQPGEVSDVVDTSIGFRIFKRTTDLERTLLAASTIVVAHNDVPPAFWIRFLKRTRSDAFSLSNKIIRELVRNPQRFNDLNEKHCDIGLCKLKRFSWRQGRLISKVESQVNKLEIGEVSSIPLDTPLGFFIVRRENPDEVKVSLNDRKNRPVLKKLPTPAPWTIADYARRFPPHVVEGANSDLKEKASTYLGLSGSTKQHFEAVFDGLSKQFKTGNKEKYAEYIEAADKRVAKLLGPKRFSDYRDYKESWFKRLVSRVPLEL